MLASQWLLVWVPVRVRSRSAGSVFRVGGIIKERLKWQECVPFVGKKRALVTASAMPTIKRSGFSKRISSRFGHSSEASLSESVPVRLAFALVGSSNPPNVSSPCFTQPKSSDRDVRKGGSLCWLSRKNPLFLGDRFFMK